MKRLFLLFVMTAVCMQFMNGQKPNSKFNGVQVGTITYSYREMPDQSVEAMLDYTLQSGINAIELIGGGAVEQYAGIPKDKDAVRAWRTTVSMDKFKEIRKMYNAKGVKIHMLNFGSPEWSDEEIDYAFKVCKTLGAIGLAMEISEETAKRMAPFADKHKMYVIFHNHGQPGNPDFSFDKPLSYSPRLMLNLDVGHYYGATGLNPCDLIKRLHNRIVSIHVKDKTGPNATPKDSNTPLGEGETPLVEILQLIRDQKWPIFCGIELEYKVPQNSDPVKEVIKCVDYCRTALMK